MEGENRLVFVVAMPKEGAAVCAHLSGCQERTVFGRHIVEGAWGPRQVAVVISGIGKSNAAAATQLALSLYRPRRILNIGVAGGFVSTMEIGEVYPVSRAVEYDFDLSQVNGTSRGTFDEYETPYLELSVAQSDLPRALTLATGDHFTNASQEEELLRTFQAGLRDMEGAAIAHVCAVAGVECRVWKCVSDVVGKDMQMTRQYAENLTFCLDRLTLALSSLEF